MKLNEEEIKYILYVFEFNSRDEISVENVKKRYKELMKKYHPDLNPDKREWAEMKTKKLNEFFPILLEYASYLERERDEKSRVGKLKIKTFNYDNLPPPNSDYNLYKRGFLIADWAFTKYYEARLSLNDDVPKELKEAILRELERAKREFALLIKRYPNSRWVEDAIDKVDKINLWLNKNK